MSAEASIAPDLITRADGILCDRLESEIAAHYAAKLVEIDSAANVSGSLSDLVRTYLDWRARQIPAEPRAVHRSAELLTSARATEHRLPLEALIARIVAGADLTPHLSRSAQTVGAHDGLFSDWGIQHLHLHPEGGLDDLLFAVLLPGNAYLLGIYPHGVWGLQELVEIVIRNWPDCGAFLVSEIAVGLERQVSDAERKKLRRAHVSVSAVEYRGRVYFPRVIGQMADGSSAVAARQAMAFIARLNAFCWNLSAEMTAIREAGESASGRSLPGEWEPLLHEGSYGLIQDRVFVAIAALA